MKTRICSKCNKELPLDKDTFPADIRYSEGFKGQCRTCAYTPAYGRMKQLMRRYKLTVEGYELLLASQDDHCALCPATQFVHTRRLVIDHDHTCCPTEITCGKCLRGILCADCNRKVGFLEDTLRDLTYILKAGSGTWTEKALAYIDSYKQKHFKDFVVAQYPKDLPEGGPHNWYLESDSVFTKALIVMTQETQ